MCNTNSAQWASQDPVWSKAKGPREQMRSFASCLKVRGCLPDSPKGESGEETHQVACVWCVIFRQPRLWSAKSWVLVSFCLSLKRGRAVAIRSHPPRGSRGRGAPSVVVRAHTYNQQLHSRFDLKSFLTCKCDVDARCDTNH